jgi:hypothetical protein
MGVRAAWERLGLHHRRPLPASIANVPTASPETRVALVRHVETLLNEALAEMHPAPIACRPPEQESLSRTVEREWEAKLTGCTQKQRIAFLQFQVAAMRLTAQQALAGGKRPKDREAYDWLREHAGEDGVEAPLNGPKTWARYVREARRKAGESKNRPRRGRSGRSIARPDGGDAAVGGAG